MRKLNGKFLNHWTATDVLTFPLHDEGAKTISGEIYVNLDQARRQARSYGVSIKEESARLVIHGALHLVGYLDGTSRQKAEMTKLEDFYLRELM